MTTPSDAAQQTRGERARVGEADSPLALVGRVLRPVGTLFGGWFLVSRGWNEQGFVTLGLISMMPCQLCDTGGAFLYLRRGAGWGRDLRVLGFAVFWPPAMAFGPVGFWFESSAMFVLCALFAGAFVAYVSVCDASARREGR